MLPLVLLRAGHRPDNGTVVALLHPECGRCSELLMDYIDAGNETIAARERLENVRKAEARRRASQALDRLLEERAQRRKRLVSHQALHRPTPDPTHN